MCIRQVIEPAAGSPSPRASLYYVIILDKMNITFYISIHLVLAPDSTDILLLELLPFPLLYYDSLLYSSTRAAHRCRRLAEQLGTTVTRLPRFK